MPSPFLAAVPFETSIVTGIGAETRALLPITTLQSRREYRPWSPRLKHALHRSGASPRSEFRHQQIFYRVQPQRLLFFDLLRPAIGSAIRTALAVLLLRPVPPRKIQRV